MAWWDYLYLNEGMSTHLDHYAKFADINSQGSPLWLALILGQICPRCTDQFLRRWEKSSYPVNIPYSLTSKFTDPALQTSKYSHRNARTLPFSSSPNRVYPEFKANTEFINDHLQSALSLDAKLSSHPIEVACPDADQIGQVRPRAPSHVKFPTNLCSRSLILCPTLRRDLVCGWSG